MTRSGQRLTIDQNTAYLKRYAFLERACMRTLAGWLAGVPEWDVKNAIGLHIWESADASHQLRLRLRELRAYQPDRDAGPGLTLLAAELDRAQNTAEVIGGVYLVVKEALLHAYEQHMRLTWEDFDNPTVKLIQEHLLDVTRHQVAWAREAFPTVAEGYPPGGPWQHYIAGLLAADGGITGAEERLPAPQRPEDHPLLLPWKECQRPAGWPIFDPSQDIEPNRQAAPEEHRLWRFKHYLNEMTAAETLATVLWMTPEMPWDFQHNVARHQWDEIRHSQLGQIRIQQLGLACGDVPQVVQIYNVMMTLPAVEQYALLATVLEPNGMPEKVANREHWEAIEDEISAAAVSYDWSDENFHIRWGKQWTPVLLETYGYTETPEQIRERMEAWMMEHTPVRMQQKMARGDYS